MTTATTTSPDSPSTTSSGIKHVAVIGFGAMGSGIAHVCAQAGMRVTAVEPNDEIRSKHLESIKFFLGKARDKGKMTAEDHDATIDRITTTGAIADAADADIVIEAVTENLEIKQSIFAELEKLVGDDTILATNTSAISVTEIAAAVSTPDRLCGLHFFNPPPLMPLVEVVKAERTTDATAERARAFVTEIGKEPIVCGDTPGFVVNRILIPTMNDVVKVYDEGTASAEDIDKGCKFGLGWPMGPLTLLDLVGIDVHVHASEALFAAYREPRMAPPPRLVRMAKAGKLGRKSGEGFYKYD